MGQEQHPREPRYRALKKVRVHADDRAPGIDCVVRSLSQNGARIEIADTVQLCDEVVLHFATENIRVTATVAWRRDGQAGLRFSRTLPWLTENRAGAD